jgi:hypothetical protein
VSFRVISWIVLIQPETKHETNQNTIEEVKEGKDRSNPLCDL